MDDTPSPVPGSRASQGFFVPDTLAEPRPPFQVGGLRQIYLFGRAGAETATRMIPPGMICQPDGYCVVAIYDARQGWGPMPYRCLYHGFEVEGYNGADGSLGVFLAAQTASGRAGEMFSRDYNGLCGTGEIEFSATDTTVKAIAPLDGGDGRITLTGDLTADAPAANAGVTNFIGRNGAGDLTLHAVSFSFSFTFLANPRIQVDLPPGHRLEYLRNLTPDWGMWMTDKSASISAPQPLSEVFDDVASRMAFLDALYRIGRAVAIVEQTGRLAFLTREAEALLKDDAGTALARLPATVTRTALANPLADPMRQPALVTLPSGRQLVARAFPIALRLGTGPLSMVLLTDPRAPGPTDPEPLLRLMGLTPAEAALATLIGQGRSPAEAARARGITQTTARSMLKTIFAKLGVSRQSELAILVTRLQSA